MAPLTTKQRDRLPNSAFAYPERRTLPIVDAAHVRVAIARVSQTQFPDMTTMKRAASRILRAAKRFKVKVDPNSSVAKLAGIGKGGVARRQGDGAKGSTKRPKRNPKQVVGSDRKLLEAARRLSERFHGTRAEVVELSPEERKALPRYVTVAGTLEDFTYRPDPSTSKRGKDAWRHQSGDRGPLKARSKNKPVVVVDPRTGKPALVANRSPMRLTQDGFEG